MENGFFCGFLIYITLIYITIHLIYVAFLIHISNLPKNPLERIEFSWQYSLLKIETKAQSLQKTNKRNLYTSHAHEYTILNSF